MCQRLSLPGRRGRRDAGEVKRTGKCINGWGDKNTSAGEEEELKGCTDCDRDRSWGREGK